MSRTVLMWTASGSPTSLRSSIPARITAEVEGLANSSSMWPMAATSTPSWSPEELRRAGDRRPVRYPALEPEVRAAFRRRYDFVASREPSHQRPVACALDRDADQPEAHARNAVFYGDKAIDRSPCGTAPPPAWRSGQRSGRLKVGDDFVHESIIGTMFRAA